MTAKINMLLSKNEQFLWNLNPRVEEKLFTFPTRLAQSLKSPLIHDQTSLQSWMKHHFGVSLEMRTDLLDYELMLSLLTCEGEIVGLGGIPADRLGSALPIHKVLTKKEVEASGLPESKIGYGRVHPFYSWMDSCVRRVYTWCLSTLQALALIGAPVPTDEKVCKFLFKYLCFSFQSLGEKVLKFHLTSFLSKTSQQPDHSGYEVVEAPMFNGTPADDAPCGLLFSGPVHNWLRRRMMRKNSKSSHAAAYTLLQSKRAWEEIPRKLISDSLVKHSKALSKDPLSSTAVDWAEEEVRRTVLEVFKSNHSKGHRLDEVLSPFPSCKAVSFPDEKEDPCYVHYGTKREGGTLGLLRAGLYSVGALHDGELVLVKMVEVRCAVVHSFYGLGQDFNLSLSDRWGRYQQTNSVDPDVYPQKAISDGDNYLMDPDRFDHDGNPFEQKRVAEVHIVLEPAKARIITAGPPVLYNWARGLQKTVHGRLRRHPTFALIGQPFSQEIVDTCVNKAWNMDHWTWASGDYSAATDNLDPNLSLVCLETIASVLGLSYWETLRYRDSLLGHEIRYPILPDPYFRATDRGCADRVSEKIRTPPITQKWGQLMGSPSSFPILCLINAAINRRFMELQMEKESGTRVRFSLDKIPLLVNGDDILFKLPAHSYPEWKELVSSIGLAPSLGKNYISDHFVMLNSEMWWINSSGSTGRLINDLRYKGEYVPYHNLGLLNGKSKVLRDTRADGEERVTDLISNAESLLKGFSGPDRDRLLSLFIQKNRERIDESTLPMQNWFVPRQLGGLGLPQPSGGFEVTRGQAKLAAFLHVQPRPGFRVPSYGGKEEADYLSYARQAEMAYLSNFRTYWGDTRDESLPSYSDHFSSIRWNRSLDWKEKGDVEKEWRRVWKEYTNTKLKPLSMWRLKSYKTRFVCVERCRRYDIRSMSDEKNIEDYSFTFGDRWSADLRTLNDHFLDLYGEREFKTSFLPYDFLFFNL